jgi:hypothetical protein
VIVVVADHGGRVERAGEAESKKALPSAATTRRHLLQVDAAQTSQSGGVEAEEYQPEQVVRHVVDARRRWSPVLRRGLQFLTLPRRPMGAPN